MKGVMYKPLGGGLGYWTNGKVYRIAGTKHFLSASSYYTQLIVRKVQKQLKDTLHSQLPKAIKRFMDTNLVRATMPWATGNLHDSIVAAVAYRNSSGDYSLAGGKAIHPKPAAKVKQRWSLSLGGRDEDIILNSNRGQRHYEGYGRDYAANYQEFARDPESNIVGSDVVVYFEATIPYAGQLNDSGIEAGWFDDLTEMLVNKLRTEVNVISDNYDDFGGAMAYGVQYQIGF